MGKKKRSTNSHDDGLSTESCDEIPSNNTNSTQPECPHVTKSVNTNKLRKILKNTGLEVDNCSDCLKTASCKTIEEVNSESDNTLWLCLTCGTQLCGRTKNEHAFQHFQKPHSDSHAIAVNTTTFEIFCYSCSSSLIARKRLLECVEFIKKIADKKQTSLQNNVEHKPKTSVEECRTILSTDRTTPVLNSTVPPPPPPPPPPIQFLSKPALARQQLAEVDEHFSLPRVRGLTNLGNTCFFNAVLQCLAQTPYLLEVLEESSESGEEFTLPGGLLKLKSGKEINRPPIKGQLNSWGPITAALAFTLKELQSSGGVLTPDVLFNKFVNKYPQFQGGQQHDSHELLRHLLESVRSEDLQRYQKVILQSISYKNENLALIDDETKQKCKAYGLQAADRILRPEQVFRGFLVSTLCCQDCNHVSPRHENFLDMSLSVCVEKAQPPHRRRTSPENTQVGPSKHQMKKEKERVRKEKRLLKYQNKKLNAVSLLAGASGDEAGANKYENSLSSSSEQSDADVEDNLIEDMPKLIDINTNIPQMFDSNGNCNNNASSSLFNEGCNSQNKQTKNEDENDSGIATSPANSGQNIQENAVGDSPLTSVKNIVFELGVAQPGASFIRQLSETTQSLEKLNILENGKVNEENKKEGKPKRVRTQSHSDWSTTIAPRYQCKDGECSIQSCLNNFTAVELMTGKNKVGCQECTKRTYGENSNKSFYTNATKQFLISSPPAVLILHLKRFQVEPRGYFRKLGHSVSFPILLDIAPYCGSKIKTLPNIDRKQKKLLYALYGIVEHAGGMHGGHYTAYVKVRPKIDKKNKRWAFIPQGSKAELDQADEHKAKLDELLEEEKNRNMSSNPSDSDDDTSEHENERDEETKNEIGEGEGDDPPNVKVPKGKWYCISDSSVHEVTEEAALRAQAYLLFYERIF